MEHNFPSQPTQFIGRQADIDHIIQLLDTHQLVTLVGMGGMGKTRLAIRLGEYYWLNMV